METYTRDLEVNGINIHVLERGSGPLLLMLHGFPEYSGIWAPYLEILSDQFHVVAPDLRGYNLSSKPAGVDAYQMELLLADMTSLVTKLGYQKAYLVGHDWGGLLTWYLAGHHPEMFHAVTIINAPHPKIYERLFRTNKNQKAKAAYVAFYTSKVSEHILSAFGFAALKASIFFTSKKTFSSAQKLGYVEAWRHGITGPINYYRAYFPRQSQLSSALPHIKIPVQVLWGERDPALTIENLVGLDELVSDLRIIRYPDSSHWVNHERVADLSARMRYFFKDEL